MNPTTCSPMHVHELFHSLLTNTNLSNSSATSHPRLSTSANPQPRLSTSAVPQHRLSTAATTTTTTAPQPLSSPPAKHSIRRIENDQNNRREKYDGCRWRLVCTWNTDECTNLAYAHQLCTKHNALRRNKQLPKQYRKPLLAHASLPIIKSCNRNNARNDDNDDDDIQILEQYCTSSTIRHSMNSNIKSENVDFNVFSVDQLDENNLFQSVKSEPRSSTNYRSAPNNDIEYISSKTRTNGLNISELVAKNIPPLTGFEEEYIAAQLMAKCPTTCRMLDAQLFVHNEATLVVKKNYRLKMDTVAPEYFYDFLLRYPRVALHYCNWFLRCKPTPPSTGCPIDTKVWTLSMIVRGALKSDGMIDECNN